MSTCLHVKFADMGSEKLRFISSLDKKLSNKLFDSFSIIIQSPDCGMPEKADFLDRVKGGSQVRDHAGYVSACPPVRLKVRRFRATRKRCWGMAFFGRGERFPASEGGCPIRHPAYI